MQVENEVALKLLFRESRAGVGIIYAYDLFQVALSFLPGQDGAQIPREHNQTIHCPFPKENEACWVKSDPQSIPPAWYK